MKQIKKALNQKYPFSSFKVEQKGQRFFVKNNGGLDTFIYREEIQNLLGVLNATYQF